MSVTSTSTVEQNARLFALINIAMAGAGLSCWSRKYEDNFWRPILGVRNAANKNRARVRHNQAPRCWSINRITAKRKLLSSYPARAGDHGKW